MTMTTFSARRAAALGLLAAIAPAAAQQPNSGVSLGPSANVAQPTPSVAPPTEHLFGDWGGVRTYLGNLGIDLSVDLTSEFAANVAGGTRRGASFANQVGFEADIDWGKLAGLTGFSTHTVIVNRDGSNASALFGDHVNAVQEIYGGGGDVVAHLVYAYAEQSLMDGRIDIAAGRMPVLNDFAASTLYCNFMNVSICGNPGSLSAGDPAFSVFPDATWGGRVRVRPTGETYVQAGAYEVSRALFQVPYFRSGFTFNTSRDTGALVPVELGYEPKLGRDRLPGHYKIGFGYDTSTYQDLYRDSLGTPALLSGAPFADHRGRFKVWALADQMLLRNGSGDNDGLIGFAAYVHGDPATDPQTNQYTAGLLDRGFWGARPQDTIGALFTYQELSGVLGKQEALQQEFGIVTASGVPGIQTHEMVLEVNYEIHVLRGVNLQPELQYVMRPNAQKEIRNATVFGVKTHVNF